MNRLRGLDSLRFICALIVIFSHFNLPLPESVFDSNGQGLHKILRGMVNWSANGPASVVVFFIISGFCIHFPNINSFNLNLRSYYIRRLIRIIPPAIIAYVIQDLSGEDVSMPFLGVFWSVICEIVYYILYPLFLQLSRYLNWTNLVLIAFLFAFILTLTHLDSFRNSNGAYCALGFATWIIGLPCWFLGCWLAENYLKFQALSNKNMWLLRCLILFISIVLKIIRGHTQTIWSNNAITLNIFAIIACLWIAFEIAYFQKTKPLNILEWAGQWSYSLYIIHPAIPNIFSFIKDDIVFSNFQKIVFFVLALVFSYIFYLIVEKPSHRLALKLTKSKKQIAVI